MRPYAIAHRGFALDAPENTLPAFRAAQALGCDGVETDVQLTGDGKLVLHHNYTIDASSDGSGAIYAMTFEELRSHDFGAHVSPKWAGTRLPSLGEFLEETRSLPLVNIELKAPVDRTLPYVETVVRELEEFGHLDHIVISAFDHTLLARVKELCPALRVGGLVLPGNFAENKLFLLLQRFYPAGKPLIEATAEDMGALPPDAFSPAEMGLPGADARESVAELAHQIGAVYPGANLAQAQEQMAARADMVAYVRALPFQMEYLHCHYSSVLRDPTLVGRLAELGTLCHVWTPDKPEELAALVKSGCHGIITNRPDLLLELEG